MFCVERLMYSHPFRLDSGCNFPDANVTSFPASSDVKILNSPVVDSLKLILSSDFQSACLENKSPSFPKKKKNQFLVERFRGEWFWMQPQELKMFLFKGKSGR